MATNIVVYIFSAYVNSDIEASIQKQTRVPPAIFMQRDALLRY
jgi:hypothetical protein